MIPWKARLYAFLLSHLLGPWLDDRSLKLLHESIEVSLQEGRLVLKNVGLNTDRLTKIIRAQGKNWKITLATLARLDVSLSLEEVGTNKDSLKVESTSSIRLAWRAMNFGTSTDVRLALLAKVVLDGIVIHMEPHEDDFDSTRDDGLGVPQPPLRESSTEPPDPATFTASAKNLLQSYMDAALASLRLSLVINNFSIRVHSQKQTNTNMQTEPWLELRIQSVTYSDVDSLSSAPNKAVSGMSSTYNTVVHKSLDFTRLSIAVGYNENSYTSSTTMVLLEGVTQVKLRVIEYGQQPSLNSDVPAQLQQDLEVFLGQKLNLFVNLKSIHLVNRMVENLKQFSKSSHQQRIQLRPIVNQSSSTLQSNSSHIFYSVKSDMTADEAEADLKAIRGIMDQYNQARAQVERNELKGGLLLPEANNGVVTFDAFFDANDKSFYRYSNMMMSRSLHTQSNNHKDWVHTKVRCHLNSASVKISFTPASSSPPNFGVLNTAATQHRRRPDEYIFATFNEIQASSSLSFGSSNHALSVTNCEIEEARMDAVQRIRIESILSFPESSGRGMNRQFDEEVLVQAPCVSMNVTTMLTNHQDSTAEKDVNVEVDIQPFVLSCPGPAVSNLLTFLSNAFPVKDKDEHCSSSVAACQDGEVEDSAHQSVRLRASCAHFDIVFPLEDISEDLLLPLFARVSNKAHDYVVSRSAVGFSVERLLIEVNQPTPDNKDVTTLEASFQRIIGYAYLRSDVDDNHRLFDIVAIGGETNLAVLKKVQASLQNVNGKKQTQSLAANSFPLAPAVSTFKARQDDDDEDVVSPLFPSSKEYKLLSRSELRGLDPQPQMLEAVSRATTSIALTIPCAAMDLSIEEVSILSKVLELALPTAAAKTSASRSTSSSESRENVVSLTLSLDQVSLALHGEIEETSLSVGDKGHFSYLVELGRLSAHVLQDNCRFQHARLLAHNVAFHEVVDLAKISATKPDLLNMEERFESVRRRLLITSETKIRPLFYRSHLFSPISRQSPALLIDVVDFSGSVGFAHKNVYLTFYDLTHRFDYDAKWMKRLNFLIDCLGEKKTHKGKDALGSGEGMKSEPHLTDLNGTLTGLFLCLADCNVDYTSPCRWKTPSRIISRFGEVRVSCTLIQPTPALQAVNFSLGDFAVCLCNSRYPYRFEDSKFVRVHDINCMEEIDLSSSQTSDDVLREMNFRTIILLDSLDANLTVADSKSTKNSQPRFHGVFSGGEINFFACKDSFSVFMSSVGELCSEACAMDNESFQKLKKKTETGQTYYDSIPHEGVTAGPEDTLPQIHVLEDLQKTKVRVVCSPEVPLTPSTAESTFLLDGYDWTTIDQDECAAVRISPGDEQAARWYGVGNDSHAAGLTAASLRIGYADAPAPPEIPVHNPFQIIPHHFPLQPTSDPLGDGDMGAAKYAGAGPSAPPKVKVRVIVSDLSLKLRLFDGYDWPENLSDELRTAPRIGTFLIDLDPRGILKNSSEPNSTNHPNNVSHSDRGISLNERSDPKAALMAGLLEGPKDTSKIFENLPLPEDRGARVKAQAEFRRLARRSDKYVQFSASGVQVRSDSMEESDNHRLVSCLNLKVQDFFVAETISTSKPIKLVGEWFNDAEHPRDSRDGLVMMKMITWNAETRVNKTDELVSDECEAAIKILPLRFFIDQKSIRFVSAFFISESPVEESDLGKKLPGGLHSIPPPIFRKFVAKPLKLKVNYKPEKLNQAALRNGQVVELLNLSPLEQLVLTLEQVELENVAGFGGVVALLASRWIQHVSSTQLLKFLTSIKPLEPITAVSEGLSDVVLLPWEALKNGGDVKKAARAGAFSFGRAVAYQALTLSSEVAAAVANVGGGRLLPPRPLEVPTGIHATTPHMVESLSCGLQAANSKIVIIPYREYQRNGTTGLVTSVIRGIPVAIAAPASGAAEALSYALIGMRNQLRPDIRREEEVSQRGLGFNG